MQKDGGEKLELTSPIKYDATTRAKRKSLFGKAVADEKTLGNMGMSPQLDGDKENASLPVVKKSGLQRPSKIRGGRRGEENVNKVGVAAVRGRRGPFRPLNGLASRQVEAPSVSARNRKESVARAIEMGGLYLPVANCLYFGGMVPLFGAKFPTFSASKISQMFAFLTLNYPTF